MYQSSQKANYQTGYYGKKRMSASAWTDAYVNKWTKEKSDSKKNLEKPQIYNSICFSRQLGAGALEIADLLAAMIQYRVADREILEHMAKDTDLTEKVIEFYDERYPGKISDLFSLLINKKTFIQSDYARQLLKTIAMLAKTEPTIFVGRGAHLILPRETVLSVRFICSKKHRTSRMANILDIKETEAEKQLNIMDTEQQKFFKTTYNKKETTLDEFDLVINRDHIQNALQAAEIVKCAFKQKFAPVD